MSPGGKRDGFSVADLRAVATVAGLPRGRGEGILAEVSDVFSGWQTIADEVGVEEPMAEQIARIACSYRWAKGSPARARSRESARPGGTGA
jgi:hypothetical protein